MSEKKILVQTLAEINKLNKEPLQALHIEVTGEAPAAELTKAQLVDAILAVGEPAPPPPPPPPVKAVPDDCFAYGDKVYKVVLHAVHIPEIGLRTKAEILFDEAAQKTLVEMASGAIQEQA